MSLTLGNSSKDSQYLSRIKSAIAGDKDHPRNQGVLMQAHHVISAQGMKKSGLGKKIEKFGYDINLLPNLAFIPCTLQGACHLGVQPHRGNHTASIISQDDYDDDREPFDYHDMIADKIKRLNLPIAKECPGDDLQDRRVIQEKLNKLSKYVLDLIQRKPSEAPLTGIATHFSPGSHIGCGGVDSVRLNIGLTPCPVERNHKNRQSVGQKAESITYMSDGKYNLKPGR